MGCKYSIWVAENFIISGRKKKLKRVCNRNKDEKVHKIRQGE